VEALGEVGVVTCFAAGNSSLDIDINSDTASLMSGTSSQICVDSATEEGKRSDFSNYGVRNTDVFSPGSHILSTYPVAMSDYLPEMAVSAPAKDGDGVDIIDDYTGAETYFSYEANSGSGTAATIADGAIKISGTDLSGMDAISEETMGYAGAGRAVALSISGNALPALSENKEYTIMIDRKAEQDMMYMMVYVKTVSGAWDRPAYSYNMGKTYSVEAYPLSGTGLYTGESFDLENPEFRIVIYHNDDEEVITTLTNAYINKIWITAADAIPFVYLQGTSMATPAVAGAVAIVAAAFPDDSAYKRASRILASVRKSDQFADICETGGMVNVRNALDESTYTPVLNNVGYTADGKIAFSGYFFGEKENTSLTVRQGEKSWSTADGSLKVVAVNKAAADAATDAESVIIECPEGIRRGELVVSISDSAKAEGRQSYTKYMEIGDPLPSVSSDTMYKRIPITTEQEAAIFGAQVETMTAINGKFYIAGADYVSGEYKTIVYDGEKTEVLGGEQGIPYSGGIAAWNGRIVSSDGEHLFIYDPEKRSLEYTELTAPYHFEEMDYAIDSLYNDGTELLLFRTEMGYYDPLEDYVYAPTEVWLVKDPYNGIMEQIGTLRNCYRSIPIVGQQEKEDGSREYYIFGSQGFAEAAFGGESFSISPELSSTVLSNMFSDDVKIFADEMNPVAGVAVKDGIFLTGMVSLKDKDAKVQDITADNFFLRYDNIAAGFLPLEKRLSETRVFAPVVGAYDGEVLVYGLDTPAGSTESLAALYSIDMETAASAGDKIIERKTDTSVKVKKIKMDKKKTVSIDYAEKLNCEVTFADPAKTAAVIFDSSNEQVVKVDSFTGELYGIRTGSATVTASCGNKTAKCVVTVKIGDQKDQIFPYQDPYAGDEISVELNSGEVDYWQLMNIYLTGKEKISWKSSDKKVVTVNKGLFTAKKGGNAVVTA
ncbi:MAG: S8 family serine peptidase, partial [Lachnospiraceae bacterium]|nr:S8 family serine peptidase [Lachnospiraceae bacterium]